MMILQKDTILVNMGTDFKYNQYILFFICDISISLHSFLKTSLGNYNLLVYFCFTRHNRRGTK